MTPIPLTRHHPAPLFYATDPQGHPISLRDYRFRRDLLLVLLPGTGDPFSDQIIEGLVRHRADWEMWETETLILQSDGSVSPELPFRSGLDPEGAIRRLYAGGGEAGAVLALIDHRGRLMDGWILNPPETVDWKEVAVTARWVAVQEPECGACEVLPGWE